MSIINPYTVSNSYEQKYTTTEKREKVSETKELSRDEIISSKELSMDEKLNLLNITKMSPEELAKGMADKLLGL